LIETQKITKEVWRKGQKAGKTRKRRLLGNSGHRSNQYTPPRMR